MYFPLNKCHVNPRCRLVGPWHVPVERMPFNWMVSLAPLNRTLKLGKKWWRRKKGGSAAVDRVVASYTHQQFTIDTQNPQTSRWISFESQFLVDESSSLFGHEKSWLLFFLHFKNATQDSEVTAVRYVVRLDDGPLGLDSDLWWSCSALGKLIEIKESKRS